MHTASWRPACVASRITTCRTPRRTSVPATGYDARFPVVARAMNTRLVTQDVTQAATLRCAVPDLACSLAEALART